MLKLKNYIKLNPKEHISKGEIVRQVAMADLEPFNRDIKKWSYVKYKSGTKFRNGDILLARITPCLENGKTSFVNSLKQGEVAVGSTEFYVLRAIEGKMDPNYLYYLSISQNFRKNLIKSMTGTSGRQRVTKEALLNYETDIPDIDNQKDIGLKLSLIDDIISINNKINDNLVLQKYFCRRILCRLFHAVFSTCFFFTRLKIGDAKKIYLVNYINQNSYLIKLVLCFLFFCFHTYFEIFFEIWVLPFD